MTFLTSEEIELTRSGRVTSRNFARLGYRRLIRGAYGRPPTQVGRDEWERRRAKFITRVSAVMAAYQGRGIVLFGVTALQVMGVALPTRLEDWDRVHILVPGDVSRPIRQGVVTHRRAYPLRMWGTCWGLPILNPVEHWLQVRGATVDELVEIGDGFLRRYSPLLSLAEMQSAMAELVGRPGTQRAAIAMKWVRPGTDSLYETKLRLLLVRAGLPEPIVNCEVPCPQAGRTFHVDLGYDKEKVAVEYDGAVHVGSRTQMEIDADRRRLLQDQGWMVITVTAEQLRTPDRIVRSVKSALISRRAQLGQTT